MNLKLWCRKGTEPLVQQVRRRSARCTDRRPGPSPWPLAGASRLGSDPAKGRGGLAPSPPRFYGVSPAKPTVLLRWCCEFRKPRLLWTGLESTPSFCMTLRVQSGGSEPAESGVAATDVAFFGRDTEVATIEASI